MGIERVSNALIPYVIEQSPRGERSYDIYSRLLNDRIVFLGEPIDDHVARSTSIRPEEAFPPALPFTTPCSS